jgi:hypothetical protein
MDWNHQGFYGLNPASEPAVFEKMKEIDRLLANDTQFVSVDLYAVNDTNYFGGLTFYLVSGLSVFIPDFADYDVGNLLTLR